MEVDISQPLLDEITVDTPYGTIQQHINYDWMPKFCTDCIYKFGHSNDECWLKETQN